ncbi:ubiquitin-conjugating enzyme E2S [Trichophyton equinum CBS 127.97]|uniref:Ubiquitin-conjugating enzyme E2S n=1 Tax=Trichophyton equinum (strain ATCC MYA-4606 / CBS 127.97) TaxID=559882 RepID=F2PMS8_TRIEC|nr:ubiquitin-conjugating enzyme E2S [Trichophyton equinum CBS 127.97]
MRGRSSAAGVIARRPPTSHQNKHDEVRLKINNNNNNNNNNDDDDDDDNSNISAESNSRQAKRRIPARRVATAAWYEDAAGYLAPLSCCARGRRRSQTHTDSTRHACQSRDGKMASNLKRLAREHASLHHKGLPPYYCFPSSNPAGPDSLTQLTVLLTGPSGTPYSQGLWRLQLRLPEDYPASPPKAFFKTRIWHPNVEESTGAVCVDTLKRDWDPKLTLSDILITISCLLIHPNPDSALNATAGSLLQENYESFARQAKLMTSIHAPIPADMKDQVNEAKGDDNVTTASSTGDEQSSSNRDAPVQTVIMKRKQQSTPPLRDEERPASEHQQVNQPTEDSDSDADADSDSENSASKENDPTLSSSPVIVPVRSPRSVLGKRPLSVLSVAEEPELVLVNDSSDDEEDADQPPEFSGMTASEKNVAANSPDFAATIRRNRSNSKHQHHHHIPSLNDQSLLLQPRRKAPKLSDSTAKRSCMNMAPVSVLAPAKTAAERKRSSAGSDGGNYANAKPLSPIISAATATMTTKETNMKQVAGPAPFLTSKVETSFSMDDKLSVRSSLAPLPLARKPQHHHTLSNLTVRPKPRTGLRRL